MSKKKRSARNSVKMDLRILTAALNCQSQVKKQNGAVYVPRVRTPQLVGAV